MTTERNYTSKSLPGFRGLIFSLGFRPGIARK